MKKKYLLALLFILIFSMSAVNADELNETLTDVDDLGVEVETNDNSTIIGNDLVKYYKNNSQYEVQVFDENHTKLNNTNVEFTINGNTYIRNVSDGIARMNINLNPGEYQITARNCYDNTAITNNITVLATIISSNLTKYFKNASQYQATLLNGTGSPEANMNVSININGVKYKRTSDKNGIVNFNINLNPGKYLLTLERDDTGLKASNNVMVLNTLFSEDLVKYYKNATQFKATLLDSKGNPQANAGVTININGVKYKRTSDKNGIINFNINLNPGKYVLTTERNDNGLKMSSDVTVLNTLFCNNLVKYYKNGSQINAKVLDDKGKPLANAKLSFNINGVFYVKLVNDVGQPDAGKTITANINGKVLHATTNSQGIATFDVSFLTKGYYTITASYDSSTISNKLLVEKGTLQVIRNVGNPSAKKIAYVVGVHPLEHRTHETLLKILPTIPGLNYCYDIYVITVTEDIGHYGDGASDNSPGRQNGQYIARNYVYPQIINGGYTLAIDVHSNTGYGVPAFVFSPVTGGAGERIARNVASKCPSINYYQISKTSSGPSLTIPLNQNGIPAFYYEEYSHEPQGSMDAHMRQLLYAVDGLKL